MAFILPYRATKPRIADSAFIAPNATLIGDCDIGDDAGIWFNAVLRGDVNKITIGARTNIQDGTVIHVASDTLGKLGALATHIGNDVTVGHMALIHACTIEDECLIGMMACVMDGAVIEKNAFVAAGSLVTPGKRIPAGQLWAGQPASYVRDLSAADIEGIRTSAAHYVRLSKDYL